MNQNLAESPEVFRIPRKKKTLPAKSNFQSSHSNNQNPELEIEMVKKAHPLKEKEEDKFEDLQDFQSGIETNHPLESNTKENLPKDEKMEPEEENRVDTEMAELERKLERPQTSRFLFL